ncbi:MAG TPA: hypothetical protein VK607_16730 [Kofleriaceae bacterium]|nr:hypothetical protein [Kofleriaceae bacterium]
MTRQAARESAVAASWGTLASTCAIALLGCGPSAPGRGSAISYVGEMTGESVLARWTCAAEPCPWGSSSSNQAAAWPAAADPVAVRLGYTVSPAVYLPADNANGATISLEFGSAGIYAGQPSAPSHRYLATVWPGQSYQVSGLADGEVLSVQADASFGYRVAPAESPPPDAGVPPDAGPPDSPAPDAGPPGGAPIASQTVTWTCTGAPCPWGSSLTGDALVWPADAGASAARLGYTASAALYLPAARANGAELSIEAGVASVYAGRPGDDSHRLIASVAAGGSLHVTGLAAGEVLSVQSDAAFTARAVLPPPGDPGDPGGPVVESTQAFWRCNIPECSGADWTGAVIAWPAWAAYQNNARTGDQSRSVFAADGTPLYPYMGAWAQGCEVTCVTGTVLIIEWQRGTDTWRATWLDPGQSHTIALVAPEDGAMIETYDGSPGFSASLRNCTPQPLP